MTVNEIGPRAEEILALAGFVGGDGAGYVRDLGDKTWVSVRFDLPKIILNIYPTVTNMDDHAGRRNAAGLMFKVAAFLAEDGGSSLVHEAAVGLCLAERARSAIVIASYPVMPIRYDALCVGFREVFGT